MKKEMSMQWPKQSTHSPTSFLVRVSLLCFVVLDSVHQWEWLWASSVDLGLCFMLMAAWVSWLHLVLRKFVERFSPPHGLLIWPSTYKPDVIFRGNWNKTHTESDSEKESTLFPTLPYFSHTGVLQTSPPMPRMYIKQWSCCWKGITFGDDYKHHRDSFRNCKL